MDFRESSQYESNFTESLSSSSSPLLIPTIPPPQPYEERRTFSIGSWEVSLFRTNLLLAFITVAGQIGQNVSLPLWIHSINDKNSTAPTVDSYFVLSFASLSFVVIFGLGTLFLHVFSPRDIGQTERTFPHLLLFLVGLCNALNGVLTVFASNSSRTPLYLQAILGTLMIPLTILFRRLILRKKPTLKKLLCAVTVTVAPIVCLIPKFVPKLDLKHGKQESGVHSVWPLVFTISFVMAAIMNVLEEKGVKMQNEMSRRGVNLVYFLFWTSAYQLLCVGSLFWLDILPWYGNVDNIKEFGKKWWSGLQCFFGAAGCDATSGTRGTMFILMYVLSYVGGANLLRHAEGATWLAIVTSLVTPLGFIFWSLFSEVPFKWQSDSHVGTAGFGVGTLLIMFPAILIYNMGAPEISLNDDN
ncbi:hypothetical protein ACROYT_G042118 [Oculina patagonica]